MYCERPGRRCWLAAPTWKNTCTFGANDIVKGLLAEVIEETFMYD